MVVSNKGIFIHNKEAYKGKNIVMLENAGFQKHENCIPYLAKYKDSHTSKEYAELKKIEVLTINLQFCREDKKTREEKSWIKCLEEFIKIEEKTKPLLVQLKKEKDHID